jgi:hypothetical protein
MACAVGCSDGPAKFSYRKSTWLVCYRMCWWIAAAARHGFCWVL